MPILDQDGLSWFDKVYPDDWVGFAHEDWVADYLESLLPIGGVFLDVGAHVGRYACRLAGIASHVYAIEPFPAGLFAHLALNDLRNVSVLRMAAWDSKCRVEAKGFGGSNPMAPSEVGHVFASTLDDVLEQAQWPDLVKIDVEGAEANVLRGMTTILRFAQPKVFVEMHEDTYSDLDPSNVYRVFDECGYAWEKAGDYHEQHYILGRPK